MSWSWCSDALLPSNTWLINYSLSEGHVPDGFKKAIVTPVIKKASLSVDDLKNYRPVSGLSCISKLRRTGFIKFKVIRHKHFLFLHSTNIFCTIISQVASSMGPNNLILAFCTLWSYIGGNKKHCNLLFHYFF